MDWVNNQKIIEKSRKWYSHFDCRTDMRGMADYVVAPEKVEKHSFYPFIHYVMEMDKYNSKKYPRNEIFFMHLIEIDAFFNIMRTLLMKNITNMYINRE